MMTNFAQLLTLTERAATLPFIEITFADGSLPLRGKTSTNATRFVSENPTWTIVLGWLIIGECIFTKHTALADPAGRKVEITPQAGDLPFAEHDPKIALYSAMPPEVSLLNEVVASDQEYVRAHQNK